MHLLPAVRVDCTVVMDPTYGPMTNVKESCTDTCVQDLQGTYLQLADFTGCSAFDAVDYVCDTTGMNVNNPSTDAGDTDAGEADAGDTDANNTDANNADANNADANNTDTGGDETMELSPSGAAGPVSGVAVHAVYAVVAAAVSFS